MRFSIVVILYNSSVQESTTLQSILATNFNDLRITLHIWNNGSVVLRQEDIESFKEKALMKGINVELYQDIRNIALSKIYNFILDKGEFDFFIPLDQDTLLDKSFFENIRQHQNLDLILPIVSADGQDNLIRFPFHIKTKQLVDVEQNVDLGAITSVTSALAIGKHLVALFKQHSLTVFDERFAFYGIDTAFFLNIHQIVRSDKVSGGCFGKIEHSLSTYVKEDKQASYNRSLEFLYYSLLYRLNYKQKSRLSMGFFIITRVLKGRIKDISGLKKAFYCLIYKRHPRTILDVKTNL